MKKVLFFILFCMGFQAFSQNNPPGNPDSLLSTLGTQKEDSIKVDLLNRLSSIYWEKSNVNAKDSVKVFSEKALELSRKLSYTKGLAEALFNLGKYHISISHNYARATPCLLESLSLFEELKDVNGISKCYLQLGLVSYILQYYEDAIKNFKLSLTYDQNPTSKYLMALSYSELDSFNNAKIYFAMAINDFEKKKNPFRLNECYMYLGKLYLELNNSDSAFYYLNKCINSLKLQNDSTSLIRPYAFVSRIYLKNNELDKAIYYADISYKMAKINFDEISLIEATTTLNKAYSIKGDYKKAFFYLNELNSLQDFFFRGSTKQKVADMQSNFDYKKKINEQKISQQKDKEIAQQQIQKEKILRNSFVTGASLLLILLGVLYSRYNIKRNSNTALQEKNTIISHEKERSDTLLLNILPSEVAEELKVKGSAAARQFKEVTVMFTDFKDFTKITGNLSPSELVAEIDTCFKAFDAIITKYRVEKIKTIGDSYMCAGGLPMANTTHATDVVKAALEMQEFMKEHLLENSGEGKPLFEMRIGIHTGPVVAGIVGVKKFAYDIWGDTVNIASRMESGSEAGKVNISGSTYYLVKDQFVCAYRGKIQAKGKGEIDMYFVEGLYEK